MPLSDKVKAICKDNYKISCARCPLTLECIDRGVPGRGREALDKWRERVNAKAEEIETCPL